jgi:DNA (cytosine-5)-methyltransferase 1
MGAGKTVDAWDEWTAKMQAKHGNGNGHGKSLAIEAARLTSDPTPPQSDGGNGC